MASGSIAALQQVWRLALPVMLSNLLQSFVNVIDVFMVGRLGPIAIAAVGMSTAIRMLVLVLLALPLAASLLHHADYSTLHEAYKKLYSWVGLNRYRITGSAREVYLRMCDVATLYPEVYLTKAPGAYLTEVS